MKRSLILTAFSFLMLAQLAWAQAPQTISYQGVLKDNDGNIVADGNYDLTFRLYDASTGGTEWWSETHTGVPVADGIFNVILGSINSFISTDPRTKFEIPYWLEIAVGISTLSPRIELTAVPYSITARGVQGYMNVFPSNGNVGIGTTTPGSKLHIVGPDVDGIMLTDSTTGAYRATLLNRETMGGQLNLNDAADGAVKAVIRGYATVDGWQASFTAGNVGIGTDRPEANLQVVGNWTLGSPEFQSPPGGFDSWLSANNGILYEGGGADYTHHFSAYGGGDIARFGISTGVGVAPDTRVVITNSGSVGIGTMSPTNRLHINSASSTVNNLQITNSSSGSSGTDGLEIGFVGSNNANVWNNENSGLVFGTNNLEQMRILNTGNVGIGTASPGANLEVEGASDDAVIVKIDQIGTDNYVGLNLERDDAEKWHIGMDDTNDYLRFRRTASSDDMVIDAAGNVGIGTPTPSQKLDVDGTVLANGFALNNLNTKISSLTTDNIDLITNNAARVRVDPSGNVGIGTLAPSAKLDVAGVVKADSILLPATERWYSIPAPEFDNNGSTKYMQPYYVYSSSFGDWHAPIHLPHGATITGFEASIYDADSVDVTVYFWSVYQDNWSAGLISQKSTTGTIGNQLLSDSPLFVVVDNQNYTYSVRVSYTYPKNYNDVRINYARIKYTVNSPLP